MITKETAEAAMAPVKEDGADVWAVTIPIDRYELHADLIRPLDPVGVVIFAHGTGSSRFSPRNRHVAAILRRHGLATLLLDLLTPMEEDYDLQTRRCRFNIPMLAERLVTATDWVSRSELTSALPVGYFGASTGAAAAIVAATSRSHTIRAIVSRGGRPDLAEGALAHLWTPTLLLVGGADTTVLAVNRESSRYMRGVHEVKIVPHATHLFEEPGALDIVAELAAGWFDRYLELFPHPEPSSRA